MQNSISVEDTHDILEAMCLRIGLEYKPEVFEGEGWYLKHEWSEQTQEDFRVWLGKFLEKRKYCKGNKRGMNMGYYEAGKLLMNYGWKCSQTNYFLCPVCFIKSYNERDMEERYCGKCNKFYTYLKEGKSAK